MNGSQQAHVCFTDEKIMHDEGSSRPRVAACITGVQRTLLELPVRSTYHSRVRVPLEGRGLAVHTFLAVVHPHRRGAVNESQQQLREAIRDAYSPRSLTLVPAEASESWIRNAPNMRCALRSGSTWANPRGDVSVLLQWHAIGLCFGAAEELERRERMEYAWMLRLRTDLVYYADVPLPQGLSPAHAYVSSSGMTNDPLYRCMNDQILICPRRLCRPYFRLLELWSSPHCNATSLPSPEGGPRDADAATGGRADGSHLEAPRSIFAAADATAPQGVTGPPDAPFVMPLPPREQRRPHMSAQWYFFARYSTRYGAPPCRPRESTEECCGPFLREVAWPYSIARGRSSLECQFRLSEYPARRPSDPDFARRPSFHANVSTYLLACRKMQAEWRRHAMKRHPPKKHIHDAGTAIG